MLVTELPAKVPHKYHRGSEGIWGGEGAGMGEDGRAALGRPCRSSTMLVPARRRAMVSVHYMADLAGLPRTRGTILPVFLRPGGTD